MAIKMKYNISSFPFKKVRDTADATLVQGQRDATETIFGEGDAKKIEEAIKITENIQDELEENID